MRIELDELLREAFALFLCMPGRVCFGVKGASGGEFLLEFQPEHDDTVREAIGPLIRLLDGMV